MPNNGILPSVGSARRDAETYRAFRLFMLDDTPEAFGDSVEEAEDRPMEVWKTDLSGDRAFFGGFLGDKLVAAANFLKESAKTASHRGWLLGVYVAPEARGSGLSQALIDTVLDHARTQVLQVHLGVGSYNTPAIKTLRTHRLQDHGYNAAQSQNRGQLHRRARNGCAFSTRIMTMSENNFSPREIVSELDRYNRRPERRQARRRHRLAQPLAPPAAPPEDMRREVSPKNILMIGPTGRPARPRFRAAWPAWPRRPSSRSKPPSLPRSAMSAATLSRSSVT